MASFPCYCILYYLHLASWPNFPHWQKHLPNPKTQCSSSINALKDNLPSWSWSESCYLPVYTCRRELGKLSVLYHLIWCRAFCLKNTSNGWNSSQSCLRCCSWDIILNLAPIKISISFLEVFHQQRIDEKKTEVSLTIKRERGRCVSTRWEKDGLVNNSNWNIKLQIPPLHHNFKKIRCVNIFRRDH